MYGYYHEFFYKYDEISSMFDQNQNKIHIGPPLANVFLNCSKNIYNFYSKDWNSTNSNILPHVFSISRINKRKKIPYFLFNKEKESIKRKTLLRFRLRI